MNEDIRRLLQDVERTETSVDILMDKLNSDHLPNLDEQIQMFKRLGIWNPCSDAEAARLKRFNWDEDLVAAHEAQLYQEVQDRLAEVRNQRYEQMYTAAAQSTLELRHQTERQHITIHSATYGGRDVTERVQKLVSRGALNIVVSNQNMRCDPQKGRVKWLIIRYTHNGEQMTKQFREKTRAVLP